MTFGTQQQRARDRRTEQTRRRHVDTESELRGLLDGKLAWIRSSENRVDIAGWPPDHFPPIDFQRQQARRGERVVSHGNTIVSLLSMRMPTLRRPARIVERNDALRSAWKNDVLLV